MCIVDTWMLIRYVIIGVYIGVGTVLGFIWYYLYFEFGPRVTWMQLTQVSFVNIVMFDAL